METKSTGRELAVFAWRVAAVHVIAYFIAGIMAVFLMNYEEKFSSETMKILMRTIDDPLIALGPILQVIQGLALALVLIPFRGVFLGKKRGWLFLFLLVFGFNIFAPQVPGPGNFEGLLYTKLSLADHLFGLPEVIAYSLLFSLGVPFWYAKPKKAWNVAAVIALVIIAAMAVMGCMDALGILRG